MTTRILKGNNLWISNPNATRFIISIPEAINLIFRAIELTKGGELFVFKMRGFKIGDICEVFKNQITPLLKKDVQLETRRHVPGEKLHENLINDIESLNLLEDDSMYISSIERLLRVSDYPGFQKSFITEYTSSEAELMDLDEIDQIVHEYLQDKNLIYR